MARNEVTLKVNTKTLDDFNTIRARLDASKYVTGVYPISSDDRTTNGVVVNVLRINVQEVDE